MRSPPPRPATCPEGQRLPREGEPRALPGETVDLTVQNDRPPADSPEHVAAHGTIVGVISGPAQTSTGGRSGAGSLNPAASTRGRRQTQPARQLAGRPLGEVARPAADTSGRAALERGVLDRLGPPTLTRPRGRRHPLPDEAVPDDRDRADTGAVMSAPLRQAGRRSGSACGPRRGRAPRCASPAGPPRGRSAPAPGAPRAARRRSPRPGSPSARRPGSQPGRSGRPGRTRLAAAHRRRARAGTAPPAPRRPASRGDRAPPSRPLPARGPRSARPGGRSRAR